MRFAGIRYLVASLIVCGPSIAIGDQAADRVALDAAIQAWQAAFVAYDADAMAALMTDDFVLVTASATAVRGREAALKVWRQLNPRDVVRISVTSEETVMDCDIAYVMGSFAHALPSGRVLRHGVFMDIWKRVDGDWRIHRHLFSDSAGAAQKYPVPVPVQDEPRLDSPKPR
jgi:ketosteroid isomerase-like protein